MDQNLTKLWQRFFKRGVWFARIAGWLPGVRMVALNGSMVTGKFHSQSDIDLYIVSAKKRIYTARVLTLGLATILGIKRTKTKIAGRICLNRYAAEDFLEITPPNHYHAKVFYNQFPLFGTKDLVDKYISANQWMKRYNFYPYKYSPLHNPSLISFGVRWLCELILGQWFEQLAKNWQIKRVAKDPRAKAPGNVVILSEQELRFHLDKTIY